MDKIYSDTDRKFGLNLGRILSDEEITKVLEIINSHPLVTASGVTLSDREIDNDDRYHILYYRVDVDAIVEPVLGYIERRN